MPSLLFVSLYEFKQFLQIVLWIAVPATLLSVAVTIFLHYRRRHKKYTMEPVYQENGLQLAMSHEPDTLPDWLASSNPDNATLLKKYEREVRRYREDYSNLEQDFRQLEEKYSDLLNKAYHSDNNNKEDGQAERYQQEIKGYKLKIAQLQQALELQTLEAKLSNDREVINQEPVTGDGQLHNLQQALIKLKEENAELNQRLAEQDYLQDVLEEKKLQTDFLQNQLEQRVKSYHYIEQQAAASAMQLHQLQQAMNEVDEQLKGLKAELDEKQEEVAKWQMAAEHNREESKQQQEALRAKITQIEEMEGSLQQLQQQQAILQSVIDDKQDAMMLLQQTITQEQQRSKDLEIKLEQSSQLMIRIYTELDRSLQSIPHHHITHSMMEAEETMAVQ